MSNGFSFSRKTFFIWNLLPKSLLFSPGLEDVDEDGDHIGLEPSDFPLSSSLWGLIGCGFLLIVIFVLVCDNRRCCFVFCVVVRDCDLVGNGFCCSRGEMRKWSSLELRPCFSGSYDRYRGLMCFLEFKSWVFGVIN